MRKSFVIDNFKVVHGSQKLLRDDFLIFDYLIKNNIFLHYFIFILES